MAIGPVQMLVLGFEGDHFTGEIAAELDRLKDSDTIPNGTSAAIVLFEHRWAIPLRDAIVRANGVALADNWIHATDLVAIGLLAESEVEAHGHG